jgi:hypothetical protein
MKVFIDAKLEKNEKDSLEMRIEEEINEFPIMGAISQFQKVCAYLKKHLKENENIILIHYQEQVVTFFYKDYLLACITDDIHKDETWLKNNGAVIELGSHGTIRFIDKKIEEKYFEENWQDKSEYSDRLSHKNEYLKVWRDYRFQ